MGMDVTMEGLGNRLIFTFHLDDDDGDFEGRIHMEKNIFSITLPPDCLSRDVHPDHAALIAILAAHPFVGKRLSFQWPISQQFSERMSVFTRYSIHSVSGHVEQYTARMRSRPALAFSGGVDSTAALLLMPKSTLSVFLNRPQSAERTSLYNKSAAIAIQKQLFAAGFDVQSIECDIEYIRNPIGFPTDLAPSIPLIALASQLNVDSIGFGMVMESAYRIGHDRSRNYSDSNHYKTWGVLFEAAGLPLYLPVAGLSEVMTSLIVNQSPYRTYSKSCIRGEFPKSCNNCWKCFRKNLITARLENTIISELEFKKWLNVKEVKFKLQKWPISHENVLSWSIKGGNMKGKSYQLLLDRMEGSARELNCLEQWLSISSELFPEKYREDTIERILSFTSAMNESDTTSLISHTMMPWLDLPQAQAARDKFNLEFLN